MNRRYRATALLMRIIKYVVFFILTIMVACVVSIRLMDIAGVRNTAISWNDLSQRVSDIEQDMAAIAEDRTAEVVDIPAHSTLFGKKIVYDGDSIAESRENNGGGYASLIAQCTGSTYENFAKGGARLCSHVGKHSVVDNLVNLPDDGDLYCFEGGINDFWANTPIGEYDPQDYGGELDTNTICGAMETIFRYCIENFQGKPVCFVIIHKIQETAVSQNQNGDTFEDYRNAMIAVCEKYSIPYYDAFNESGLNGWSKTQSDLFLTANTSEQGDGIHPNEAGYQRYYVPQLLDLFEKIIPVA